jgi:hypothetical protein
MQPGVAVPEMGKLMGQDAFHLLVREQLQAGSAEQQHALTEE